MFVTSCIYVPWIIKKQLLEDVILKFYMMKVVYGKTTHYMVKWAKNMITT